MGKFITFEGGEGSGKSSIITKVAEWLLSEGYSCVVTKDPGGTDIGNRIRKILLTKENIRMAKETELLLYLASRAELVHKVIKPSLETHDFVLCDRFHDSTAVYQGIIRGWNQEAIEWEATGDQFLLDYLHEVFSANIVPDRTFILDVDPKTGLSRSLGPGKNEGKWEAEGLAIHRGINQEFLAMAVQDYGKDGRFLIANANLTFDEVLTTVLILFKNHILEGGNNG